MEVRSGTQSRNLESVTEEESVKESCLLACSACFLIQSKTTLLEQARPQWSELPTSISNQESSPQTNITKPPPQLMFPLPRSLGKGLVG